jgi:hypothetical protein
VKFSHYLFAMLILTSLGCARSHSSPGPCETGLNTSQCNASIKGQSAWITNRTVSQLDEKTQKPIAGTEKDIQVKYEFTTSNDKGDQAPLWRRSIVVKSDNDKISMFQEGVVTKLTGNSIDLSPRVTSCDDSSFHLEATDFTLYFSRVDDSLQFSTAPIVQSTGIIQGIANVFAQSISEVVTDVVEQAFALGSARTFLTSGRGHFMAVKKTASAATEVDASSTENMGRIGCFSVIGSGFSESKIRPSW